jgi:hypothetical protein
MKKRYMRKMKRWKKQRYKKREGKDGNGWLWVGEERN